MAGNFKTSRNTAINVDKIDVGLDKPLSITHVYHPNPPKEYEARIDVGGGTRINLDKGIIQKK